MGVVEVAGVGAIIAGVAFVAFGAPPHHEAHRGGTAVIGVLGAMSLAGVLPLLVRGRRLDTGMGAIVASGAAFGVSNIATKLMSDDVGLDHWVNAATWAAVGLALGLTATLTGMTAFQRRRATTVVPVSTAIQTFLPIVLGPLFLRERWASAPYDGAPLVAGVVLALLGAVLVSRSRAIGRLAARAQPGTAT